MKIFITRKIPEPGLDLLRKDYEIEVFPHDGVPTKKEILDGLKGKDGLLCLLSDPIDAEVINSEPKLKMIANYAVGFNNIDIAVATKRGISVRRHKRPSFPLIPLIISSFDKTLL